MTVYDGTGNALSAVYDGEGIELDFAYDGEGNVIYTKVPPEPLVLPEYDYDNYTVTSLFTYSSTNMQSFAVYNGKIAQVKQTNAIHIIDLQTGTLINSVSMDTGHGNSCQFSDEFFDRSDQFPLFYVRNSGIWVYRIVGNSSSLVRVLSFSASDIGTYVAGFGVDSASRRIYTVSYTEGDYTTKTGLLRVCEWDMDDTALIATDTYQLGLLRSNDITWFDKYEAVQGCCYHDGYLFVAAGQNKQRVALIDLATLTITHTVVLSGSEIEGCAWVGNEYMIVGQSPTNISYKKVEFEEVQSLTEL